MLDTFHGMLLILLLSLFRVDNVVAVVVIIIEQPLLLCLTSFCRHHHFVSAITAPLTSRSLDSSTFFCSELFFDLFFDIA